MQAAGAGMRVPGAARAVLLEDLASAAWCSRRDARAAPRNPRRRRPVCPRSFIDIMMLRPEVRTSVIAACSSGSSTSTTPPHLRAALVPGEAEIAHQLVELAQPAQILVLIVLAELDQQDGVRRRRARTARASGGTSRSRAPARSWCGRPARPRSASAARYAGRHPSPRRSCRNGRRRPRGGRAAATASVRCVVEKPSVPSEPTRICARLRSFLPGTSASRL